MNSSVQIIPVFNLALAFVPVLIVLAFLFRWSVNSYTAVHALARMLVQLVLIGYVLTWIFTAERGSVIILVLAIMLGVSSWIAMRSIQDRSLASYFIVLGSIIIGGVSTLFFVTGIVLELQPWFLPQYMIPLAGMIFANSMNTVSLAAERFESEIRNGAGYDQARRTALNAALIPIINTLFAVGIVSLPGMMTGQILSGVDPLIAVRYQIMVMCMIFGSTGISAACYLLLLKEKGNPAMPVSPE